MAQGSEKVVIVAALGNGAIAIAKFTAAVITGSSAMMAEGFHSVADTGNELLLLLGIKRSKKPPDRQHPFGHGKELYFWGIVVAMSVFAVGGGLSVLEGIYRLTHPEPMNSPIWSFVVLGIAFLFEGYSWTVARAELKKQKRPCESYYSAIRRSKQPAVFTPFVEDSVALVGIVIAFLGVLLSHVFDAPYLDPTASVLIGLLLGVAAVLLAIETGGLLIGETTDVSRLDDLCYMIQSDAAVVRVGKLLTMQLGPDEVLLNADIGFKRGLNVEDLEQSVDRIENAIRATYPEIKRIYFETEAFKQQDRSRDVA